MVTTNVRNIHKGRAYVNKKANVNKYTLNAEYNKCRIQPTIENNNINNNECKIKITDIEYDSSDKCISNSHQKCVQIFESNLKFIKIINFNAQGTLESSHFDNINILIKDLNADVIAISESWLKKSINNRLIHIDNYKIFRSDRNFNTKNSKKSGGGVCAFIRDDLRAKIIEKSNGTDFSLMDFLILEVTAEHIKFISTLSIISSCH